MKLLENKLDSLNLWMPPLDRFQKMNWAIKDLNGMVNSDRISAMQENDDSWKQSCVKPRHCLA